MNIKLKLTLIASSLFTLYGCGGNNDTATHDLNNDGGQAPMLDVAALVSDRSSTEVVEDVVQWNVNFLENESSFGPPAEPVKFYDIDLLEGVTDADTPNLRIDNLQFIWLDGPDCALTLTDAVDFPHICDDLLAQIDGVEAGSVITPSQAQEIRELQNLPVVSDPLFGFEVLERRLRVTPSNFAPILRSGEKAVVGIKYDVTDGVNVLPRRIVATVNGIDHAPQFIETNNDGSPRIDSNGNQIPVTIAAQQASVKFEPAAINLTAGFFDKDIFDAQAFAREVGNLEDFFKVSPGQEDNQNVYTEENVFVQDLLVTANNGSEIPSGLFQTFRRVDPITGITSRVDWVVDPSVYQSTLVPGESLELTVAYNVTDGENDTPRSFTFTIFGAAETNAPIFFGDLNKTLETSGSPEVFNLTEQSLELDADSISVVGLMPANGTDEVFGIIPTGNSIVVDPIYFSYLVPGESETFSYSYKLSDGTLESEERQIDILVSGVSANLAARATGSDSGFETGSLEQSAWRFQPDNNSPATADNLVVTDALAHTGDYSLSILQDAMFFTLGIDGIQQNQIEENDRFYINFFTQVSKGQWDAMNVVLNAGDVFNRQQPQESLRFHGSLGITNDWVERTGTFVASDYFSPTADETFSLSFLMNETSAFDDLSIIKFNVGFTTRLLISNGQFTSPSAQGWSLSGGSLTVNTESGRFNNNDNVDYGLHIINDTADTQQLMLDPDLFTQGAVKQGMRYIIQFDMRTPSYTDATGAIPIDFGIYDVGGATFSKRVDFAERNATQWTTYYMHIDTTTDSKYFGGVLNNDPNFDWQNATIQPILQVRPGDELQIDNVFMYPVPKY